MDEPMLWALAGVVARVVVLVAVVFTFAVVLVMVADLSHARPGRRGREEAAPPDPDRSRFQVPLR